ncbi:MAG TPA: YbhB/YbcL family Raf kinase inhibitor-like protein [Terriglobia bacterium]|nr:YbhB/YbcL family Raf kinase inhibitor-like protein [Terriglobia bacterium]
MTVLRARRASWLLLLFSAGAVCVDLSWRATRLLGSPDAVLNLTTSSFRPNGEIPARFTCNGDDVSPALAWNDPPAGTHSFALVVNDPDAPGGNFVHWVIYDLPASTRSLPEGVAQGPDAGGGRQGTNGFGKTGYNGPCPPAGKPHRYFFRVWALDSMLGLHGATAQDLESSMQGHILARGEIMGRFRR